MSSFVFVVCLLVLTVTNMIQLGCAFDSIVEFIDFQVREIVCIFTQSNPNLFFFRSNFIVIRNSVCDTALLRRSATRRCARWRQTRLSISSSDCASIELTVDNLSVRATAHRLNSQLIRKYRATFSKVHERRDVNDVIVDHRSSNWEAIQAGTIKRPGQRKRSNPHIFNSHNTLENATTTTPSDSTVNSFAAATVSVFVSIVTDVLPTIPTVRLSVRCSTHTLACGLT